MAFDHIFYEFVKHVYSHATGKITMKIIMATPQWGNSAFKWLCHERKSNGIWPYFFMNLLNVCSQVTTPLIFCMVVDCTPYHDWGAMVTVQWLDACIYRSLPLPAVHTSTTITVKLHGARLITEETVPLVPGVPHAVRSSAHKAASPVIHSPSGIPGGRPRLIASC